MYSLNQVNKLVSCGRDPARSLPFWRGFLLIPLILVWLAFAPNAQTQTPDPGAVGGMFNTADGFHALFNVIPALQMRHSVGFRSFSTPPAASILALVLERWSSTTQM